MSLPSAGRRVILCLLLFLCGALDAAQTYAAAPELSFQVQPLEAAWQQSTVTSICQTRDGYVWLGTYHGLVRYDGARFTVYDAGNSGLPNGLITSLFEDVQGTLWIGHETGQISQYRTNRFSPIHLNQVWPGGPVEAISADAQNDIWLLSNNGCLLRARDEKCLPYPRETSSGRKPSLARGADNNLYVISSGRLALVQQDALRPIEFDPGESPPYVEGVLPAGDGSLWIADNGRLRQWRHGEWGTDWKEFPTEPGSVTALLELRNGSIVAGTIRNGLLLLNEHRVSEHYTRDQGLSHNWVRALCEDHEGNVWAATGNGFNTLVPRKIGWLIAPDLFQGCAVFSLAVGTDGSAWMGTEGAGLYHYSTKGLWTRYTQGDGMSNLFVWSVLQTRQDKILASTWGGGVLTRNNERFEPEPLFSGLASPVLSMFESQNGALWVGTTAGLYQYRGGKLQWSVGEEKLALPDVRAIAEGADGTIWFGMSGGGLGAVKDGKVRQFRKSDGAGSDFVLCVYAGADDSIWYGTADNGLARVKDSRFSLIRPENGLPTSTISHIVQDGNGDFWLGSLAGLLRARKEDLENCANGATQSVRFLAFGRDDGMLSQTCSGGFQPGACRAPDGRLWFPTSRGVAVVNPATVSTNLAPPPILIEEFRVDTPRSSWKKLVASPSTPNQLRIEPGRHRIQIGYTGLSYAAPAKVRFRHRLEGLETEWVDAGTRREAEYAYLRPGEYRFRVIGCNNDEVWNETGAEISFIVLPFFWQTLWFQITASLAGGLALAAGVWGVSRRRVRRKLEQLEQQRALERERARIARDIHDDLGASLTRITLLSQSVRGEVQALAPAAREVDAIYETARNLTRSMDEIVWAVNPKHDSLDSLVTYLGRFAQAFLSSAGLRCRLDLPLTLPPCRLTSEVRHNVFLAFKEALNNVVKHARATEVRVSMEIRSDEEGVPDPSLAGFALVVTDNGRGFDFGASAQQPDTSVEARLASGNGIYNMHKRLEEIGGVCEWTTAPGEGARVRFVVPPLPRHQKTGQSFRK